MWSLLSLMKLNLSSLMILIGFQWSWKCRSNQSHPKKGLYPEMLHDKGFPFVLQPQDLRGPYMKLTNPCCFPFHHSWNPCEVILSHIFTSPSFHLPLWPSLQSILLIPKFGSTQPSLFSPALVYKWEKNSHYSAELYMPQTELCPPQTHSLKP